MRTSNARTPPRNLARGSLTTRSLCLAKYAVVGGVVLSLVLCVFLRAAGPENLARSAAPSVSAEGGQRSYEIDVSGTGSGNRQDAALNEEERLERRPPVQELLRSTSAMREYLNGLVAASAADVKNQLSNLAMFKTHKTGSTTMALLFHRYGARHGLEVAHFSGYGSTIPIAEAAEQVRSSGKRVDIMHYHIDTAAPRQEPWRLARERYRDVMRNPESIRFVTLLRDPRDRLLSFYNFFVEAETRVPIQDFLRQPNPDPEVLEQLRSLGCKEFGVETEEELQDFIDNDIPQFELIVLTERFDEGLMVLRRLLGWHLIDMTYVHVNRSAGREVAGGVLKERSPFEKLPGEVQEKIDDLTALDRRLYDAGVEAFEKSRAPIADEVDADLLEFEELQGLMNDYLERVPTSPVLAMFRYKGAVYYEQPPPKLDF